MQDFRAPVTNGRRMGLNMALDIRTKGKGHTEQSGADGPGEGSATRRRILKIALTLMSQRGVDGTSMRDLASAVDLNVASLYHYFPSKRDLLEAVLVEQGVLPLRAPLVDLGGAGTSAGPAPGSRAWRIC